MKKKQIIRIVITIIFLCTFLYSGYKIYKWYIENKKNNNIIEKIDEAVKKEESTDDANLQYKVDFNILKEQNDETVAWIKVNNTNIEYPVVKAKNNDFYLNHNFEKNYNSAGWVFADYKNKFDGKDKNIVIYGHNRKDGSMFGTLKNVLNDEWYNNDENVKIILNTEDESSVYDIFSIYKIEKEDYYIRTEFKNLDEFEKFLNTIKNRSIKNFDVDISKEDNILTLSTCADNNKYRVVVHAKKIK